MGTFSFILLHRADFVRHNILSRIPAICNSELRPNTFSFFHRSSSKYSTTSDSALSKFLHSTKDKISSTTRALFFHLTPSLYPPSPFHHVLTTFKSFPTWQSLFCIHDGPHLTFNLPLIFPFHFLHFDHLSLETSNSFKPHRPPSQTDSTTEGSDLPKLLSSKIWNSKIKFPILRNYHHLIQLTKAPVSRTFILEQTVTIQFPNPVQNFHCKFTSL